MNTTFPTHCAASDLDEPARGTLIASGRDILGTPRDVHEMLALVERTLGIRLDPQAREHFILILKDFLANRFTSLTLSPEKVVRQQAHDLFRSIFSKRSAA